MQSYFIELSVKIFVTLIIQVIFVGLVWNLEFSVSVLEVLKFRIAV